MTTEPLLSPGAIAERLGYPVERVCAAIKACGLRDEHGRLKHWFSLEDADGPIKDALATDLAAIEHEELAGDEQELEPVSAEDVAEVENQLGRPLGGKKHRGRR